MRKGGPEETERKKKGERERDKDTEMGKGRGKFPNKCLPQNFLSSAMPQPLHGSRESRKRNGPRDKYQLLV